MKYSHIVAGGRYTASDIGRWSRAELDLATWLQRQETSSGYRAWPFKTVKDFANPFKRDW